jgi:hypothetical protein
MEIQSRDVFSETKIRKLGVIYSLLEKRRIVTPHDNSALDTRTNSIKIMGFDRIICR